MCRKPENTVGEQRWAFVAAVCALVLSGCATYQSEPLKPDEVDRRLERVPDEDAAQAAAGVEHRTLRSVPVELSDGVNADEAALLAVVMNPQLRADRDDRGIARAQVLQAGILPNPTLDASLEVPTDGNLAGTGLGYSVGLGWDFRRLITRGARTESQRQQLRATELDIAWKEWQAAQAARLAVVRVAGLTRRLEAARQIADVLAQRVDDLEQAMQAGDATMLEVSSVRSSLQDARLAVSKLREERERSRLSLNAAIGIPPTAHLQVQDCATGWRAEEIPPVAGLLDGLQGRRLDLVGLRHGYQSQEASVRAAILEQFPAITVGFAKAQDTSFVGTVVPSVSVDVPLFDRNQGAIATERATRKKLYDTYVARVADARANIADLRAQFVGVDRRLSAARTDLDALEKLVGVAQQEEARGGLTAIEAGQLRDRLLSLRLQAAELEQSRNEAAVSLEIASGMYFRPAACQSGATSSPAHPTEEDAP